jgi:hypothetical protein
MKNTFDTYVEIAGVWESALAAYSEDQFVQKPSPERWSIGQVYGHLVLGTLAFHVQQMEECMGSNANQKEKKSFAGKFMFLIHKIPPVQIKVPPSPSYTPQQPESKDTIYDGFRVLRKKLFYLSGELEKTEYSGKTKHPALGYLDASEWYQLIVMHFHHHLLQKKRIDLFLRGS